MPILMNTKLRTKMLMTRPNFPRVAALLAPPQATMIGEFPDDAPHPYLATASPLRDHTVSSESLTNNSQLTKSSAQNAAPPPTNLPVNDDIDKDEVLADLRAEIAALKREAKTRTREVAEATREAELMKLEASVAKRDAEKAIANSRRDIDIAQRQVANAKTEIALLRQKLATQEEAQAQKTQSEGPKFDHQAAAQRRIDALTSELEKERRLNLARQNQFRRGPASADAQTQAGTGVTTTYSNRKAVAVGVDLLTPQQLQQAQQKSRELELEVHRLQGMVSADVDVQQREMSRLQEQHAELERLQVVMKERSSHQHSTILDLRSQLETMKIENVELKSSLQMDQQNTPTTEQQYSRVLTTDAASMLHDALEDLWATFREADDASGPTASVALEYRAPPQSTYAGTSDSQELTSMLLSEALEAQVPAILQLALVLRHPVTGLVALRTRVVAAKTAGRRSSFAAATTPNSLALSFDSAKTDPNKRRLPPLEAKQQEHAESFESPFGVMNDSHKMSPQALSGKGDVSPFAERRMRRPSVGFHQSKDQPQ